MIWTSRQINQKPSRTLEHRSNLTQIAENYLGTEKEVVDMTRKIAQDNINKSLFLDTACHDLKQSLFAVTYSMEALATTQINEKQKPIIKSLHNSINAMECMLTTLLDTSRLGTGIIQPDNQHFELKKHPDQCTRSSYGP